MTWEIVLFIVCIVFSAFFSASETAFTSLSIMKVKYLEEKKGQRGKIIGYLSHHPEILLTTILFGNNLVNLTASAIVTKLTIELFSGGTMDIDLVTTISTGILTLVILIFGEVTPKRIAFIYNEFIALHTARLIMILSWIFRPFVLFISVFSTAVTKAARLFSKKKDPGMTLEGLIHMVHFAESLGVVDNHETQLVKNVFRFNDVTIRLAMTHRMNVFSLPSDLTIDAALDRIVRRGYSRIPVYEGNPENVVGVVLVKEIMRRVSKGETKAPLKELALTPLFVPETKTVNEMFSEFKRHKVNMAVVLDEYGGLAGIITLEDVIEEILGELYDENEERKGEKIVALKENVYRIEGDTPLYQVGEKVGVAIGEGLEAETFGGLIAEVLGRIPTRNEVVLLPEGRVIVEAVAKNRVLTARLLMKRKTESESESEPESESEEEVNLSS